MLRRAREVEVNESALTFLVAFVVAAMGFVFFIGARVGRDVAQRSGHDALGEAELVARMESLQSPRRLPDGFIGPPGRPYPPPVDETPGAGRWSTSPLFAVEVAVVADELEGQGWKRRLLAQSFPSYVVSDQSAESTTIYRVRIGDYATSAEADMVARAVGAQDGFVGSVVALSPPD